MGSMAVNLRWLGKVLTLCGWFEGWKEGNGRINGGWRGSRYECGKEDSVVENSWEAMEYPEGDGFEGD